MVYRKIKDGAEVSVLGFGCMRFACDERGNIDQRNLQNMVDLSIKSGVNYFDTAVMYHDGLSEAAIGKALKKYPRDSYFLTNKMASWLAEDKSPEGLEAFFQGQLDRCGVQYFDFYLCHSILKSYISDYENGILDFLINKKKEGKIKRLGFSFHDTPDTLRKFVKMYDWDFAQIQFNYMDYIDIDAKTQYEILHDAGIPVAIMEPVRGGTLAALPSSAEALLKAKRPNDSIASWAIRYAMDLDGVYTVLSGMTIMQHVQDNLNTAANFKPFTADEAAVLNAAANQIRRARTIACTGCKYCADCPLEIDIAATFAVYNKFITGGQTDEMWQQYAKLKAKVSTCISCNKCASHCPQGLDIPTLLKKVRKALG